MCGATLLIERFAKRSEPVSVMVFDLDNFKRINDRFGHVLGDETLRLFASVASINMRASDLLGRFGGEEFVAILPGNASEAAVAAERVRAAFEAAGVMVADQVVDATVSIGVASGSRAPTSFLHRGRRRRNKAKDNGRNRVELADEHPSAPPRDGRLAELQAGTRQAAALAS